MLAQIGSITADDLKSKVFHYKDKKIKVNNQKCSRTPGDSNSKGKQKMVQVNDGSSKWGQLQNSIICYSCTCLLKIDTCSY